MSLENKISDLSVRIGQEFKIVRANSQTKLYTDPSLFIDGNFIRGNVSEFSWEESHSLGDSRIITAGFPEVIKWKHIYKRGQRLDSSQYRIILPNQIEILDNFEMGDTFVFVIDHYVTQP